jgi:DMSO/TMAO reductase YedYZ molybdopterin-dependent catalytic subunit
LLDRVSPTSLASHLTFHCIGGTYLESLPISVAREAKSILAYGVGESSLPLSHGFPVRVVVPRLLGYKNAKYVERIEVTDHPETGYWEKFGYPYDAPVPPTRLRPGKY